MKPKLIDNLFWAKDSKVYLNIKVENVVRYQIFRSLDPLEMIHTDSKIYNFKNGEVLEVTIDDFGTNMFFSRRFFKYDTYTHRFVELKFEEHDDYEEGEDVLLKHLGLVGLKYKSPALAFIESTI